MTLDEIKTYAEENQLRCIDKFETHQSAIIGITEDCMHLVYSNEKLVESFMNRDNISEEDAQEWIDYNVVRALPYYNPVEPILVHTID